MFVKQFINSIFHSNTYLIGDERSNAAWLVDIGDVEPFTGGRFDIKGVFITHSHFDHIYGVNKLLELFPGCGVYASEYGRKGLYSEKLNYSFYHETPMTFLGKEVIVLADGDAVELFPGVSLKVLATPGHDPGCLSYSVEDHLFTGDSYIPGIKVVTNLRGGDKDEAARSVSRIRLVCAGETVICPGHGGMESFKSER